MMSFELVFSQNGQLGANKNLISVKFTNYSIQTDKLLQKEFKKNDGYKTVYTCIPAGVLVIESEKSLSDIEKGVIRKKIETLNSSLVFELRDDISLSQAEASCASKRTLQ